MEFDVEKVPIRVSRIVLTKENGVLIFNDRFRITFKRRKTFTLIWCLLRAMKEKKNFQALGGVPGRDLHNLCESEGYISSLASINTRWHDEVQLKRNKRMTWNLYNVTDIKRGEKLTGNTDFLITILQLIFPQKITAPKEAGLAKNTSLFTTTATPDQIYLFPTIAEAMAYGFKESGSSKATKYRYDTGIVGFSNWQHKARIFENGTALSEIEVQMVNLASIPLLNYAVPLWSDSEVTVNERNIQAFTKSGKKLKTEVTVGNNKKGKHVEFALFFPKPLETGEKYEFKYSYVTPRTYKEGEEYFEWYFGQPHYQYLIDMKFDPLWYIENPVIYCDQDKDWFKINKISAQHFKWRRPFPKIGSTYRINFRLKKTTT